MVVMNKNQKRNRRTGNHTPIAEINVTPLVDVMLVLLVVFMITAPLLTSGVNVNLPTAEAEALPGTDEPVTITIDSEGRVFLEATEVEADTVGSKLAAVIGAHPDRKIFVRGDSEVNYGRIMQVVGQVTAAGYPRVALVTVPPKGGQGN